MGHFCTLSLNDFSQWSSSNENRAVINAHLHDLSTKLSKASKGILLTTYKPLKKRFAKINDDDKWWEVKVTFN
jgi:hypothetical protein